MIEEQLAAAIGGAHLRTLDDLSRDIWRAHASGMIDDAGAQRLAKAAHDRRAHARRDQPPSPQGSAQRTWSYFPAKRTQQTPDRRRSIARRRTLAASSPMPPAVAASFTVGELATLRIVIEEVRLHHQCAKTLAEIAARAGVSPSTARNAIREAARLGLVTVEERRVHGQKNLPNVVRIVSRAWLDWLGTGFKKVKPTDISCFNRTKKTGWNPQRDRIEPPPASGRGLAVRGMSSGPT